MTKIVHYIGLDVHKDSIAVSIAPQNSTEIRRYGIIGGTLQAIDNLLKKLSKPVSRHRKLQSQRDPNGMKEISPG